MAFKVASGLYENEGKTNVDPYCIPAAVRTTNPKA